MKILTKIWKKFLNEAGVPVFHIIDELGKNFSSDYSSDVLPNVLMILLFA